MDELEAKWLRALLQNPISDDENKSNYNIRNEMFNCIDKSLK